MSRRYPDRDLRRLVAELASVGPEDLEAILGDLDAPQRRTVTELLAAYAGAAEPPPKGRPAAASPKALALPLLVSLSISFPVRKRFFALSNSASVTPSFRIFSI